MTEIQCILQLIGYGLSEEKSDEYVKAAKQYGSVPIRRDHPYKTLLVTHNLGEFTIWSEEPARNMR